MMTATSSHALPKLARIAARASFCDHLAAGLWAASGEDSFQLADMEILLPTRRATRTLRDAFLRLFDGKPMLLPHMTPVADVSDLIAPYISGTSDSNINLADTLPAVAPERRQLCLARLIQAAPALSGSEHMPLPHALSLAYDLGLFLDEMETAEVPHSALDTLVEKDFAAHWELIVNFLKIITESWPKELAALERVNPSRWRNQLLDMRTTMLQRGSSTPVIAAGLTSSFPALSRLLKQIYETPGCSIVFDGAVSEELDLTHIENSFDESHPQYEFTKTMSTFDASTKDVVDWSLHWGLETPPNIWREALLHTSFGTIGDTEALPTLRDHTEAALEGLEILEARDESEEALAIAARMRMVIETPRKTVSLVTSDRGLATRVSALLRRWQLNVDDSAGRSLQDTPVGTFLQLVADFRASLLSSSFEPVTLMALLKHPLTGVNRDVAKVRSLARKLEQTFLRQRGACFRSLTALRHAIKLSSKLSDEDRDELCSLMSDVESACALVSDCDESLETRLRQHIAAAEILAGDKTSSGAVRLWQKEDGEAAALALANLLEVADAYTAQIKLKDWPDSYRVLVTHVAVRRPFNQHPRLFIRGLAETRLHSDDLMILGGLNEGVWPTQTAHDPWLSRQMRLALGLPSPDIRTGNEAHDYFCAASAPHVCLSFARRREGKPVPVARWISRLSTTLQASDPFLQLSLDHLKATPVSPLDAIDDPKKVRPCSPPAPNPPAEARPKSLSITEIQTLIEDPYSIYAKHVLELRQLESLNRTFEASEFGTAIHDGLCAYLRAKDRGPVYLETLITNECLNLLPDQEIYSLYRPQVRRLSRWFFDWQTEREAMGWKPYALEANVSTSFTLESKIKTSFHLKGRVDRVDLRGTDFSVIDYKTSQKGAANQNKIKSGDAPQLGLSLALVEDALNRSALSSLRQDNTQSGKEQTYTAIEAGYCALTGRDPIGKWISVPGLGLGLKTFEQLASLIKDYQIAPYLAAPHPNRQPSYRAYLHLARDQEWRSLEMNE